MSKFVCIDPGISGTGWAFFRGHKLIEWGIIRGKGEDFNAKSKNITIKLYGLLKKREQKTFIEWPTFQNVYAQNTHSIPKLAFLIGRIYDLFKSPKLIKVSAWRGNCPKEVLWKRAEKYFGKSGFSSHAGDAVAMGQYVLENNLI